MSATNRQLDNRRCKAKNRWPSVDVHIQNGAMTVSLSISPIMAAITSIMPNQYQITLWLADLEDWKLLTLHWRSFAWWGNKPLTHCFAWKGRQYIVYGLLPQINTYITQDEMPKIFDAMLMLIFRIGLWLCCLLFCLWRQRIQRLCYTVIKSLYNFLAHETKNHSHCIDAHF